MLDLVHLTASWKPVLKFLNGDNKIYIYLETDQCTSVKEVVAFFSVNPLELQVA